MECGGSSAARGESLGREDNTGSFDFWLELGRPGRPGWVNESKLSSKTAECNKPRVNSTRRVSLHSG
jgi:hypothetical protein